MFWFIQCFCINALFYNQVYEYLVDGSLFHNSETPDERAYTDLHLRRMVEFLGPFPKEILINCSLRAEYFDDRGES